METIPADNPLLLQRLANEVHVWLSRPEDVTDPDQFQVYQSLLSVDEMERYRRFHFDLDRHHYLVAHALLRRALSAYVDVDPSAWQFSLNRHGRPEISGPDIVPALRFNLTHTRGLVACVVALGMDCGIDAERVIERGNPMAIAEKIFAAGEQEVLEELEGQDFLDRFFAYWTLREAHCKALGVGIAYSNRDCCFMEASTGQWAIRFDAQSDEECHHWQLAVLRPTMDHVVAVAIRTADLPDKSVIHEFVVP